LACHWSFTSDGSSSRPGGFDRAGDRRRHGLRLRDGVPGSSAYHLDAGQDRRVLATEDDEWEGSDPKALYVIFGDPWQGPPM
jgi:hypothetical protein